MEIISLFQYQLLSAQIELLHIFYGRRRRCRRRFSNQHNIRASECLED